MAAPSTASAQLHTSGALDEADGWVSHGPLIGSTKWSLDEDPAQDLIGTRPA